MEYTNLDCQKAYKVAMSSGKTPEMTDLARAADKASHAELNVLRAQGANSCCFDCDALKPGWAVLPWGIYVCIDCAQVHRNMGRHISQTKAINTGTYLWYPHELQVMREIGNERAARAWKGAPPKPTRDSTPAEKAAYARDKYELRKWGPVYENDMKPVTTTIMTPAGAPVMSLKKPKPSTGLAQAKRVHAPAATPIPSPPPALEVDLINLAEQPAQSTAAEVTDATAVFTRTAAAPPAPAGWDVKKADVLSLFVHPPTNGYAMPRAPMAPFALSGQHPCAVNDSPAAFFARFGL
mmetsp:Transcript_60636/g.135172  ORF Transcript_60636/g.135172 Transcript_60636/m.135172 type:complete len:295 (-) Transcript_60636:335-1219(-)